MVETVELGAGEVDRVSERVGRPGLVVHDDVLGADDVAHFGLDAPNRYRRIDEHVNMGELH